MADAVPTVQVAAAVGCAVTWVLFAEPQTPTLGGSNVLQATAAPPFKPVQLQLNGLMPVMADAVPTVQVAAAVGCVDTWVLFAEPQTPAFASGRVLQETDAPPFNPAQLQSYGFAPLMAVAVPAEHVSSAAVGLSVTGVLFFAPQTPLTGGGVRFMVKVVDCSLDVLPAVSTAWATTR